MSRFDTTSLSSFGAELLVLAQRSVQNLLADLNPEAHEFGKKVMADKKEIEAKRCWCQSWLVTQVVN
jgi:hypothetical protein